MNSSQKLGGSQYSESLTINTGGNEHEYELISSPAGTDSKLFSMPNEFINICADLEYDHEESK